MSEIKIPSPDGKKDENYLSYTFKDDQVQRGIIQMKKVVLNLMAVIVVLVLLSGCGGTQVNSVEKTNTDAPQRETASADETEEAKEENESSENKEPA